MNPYNFCVLMFAFCTFLIGLLIWLKRADSIGKSYFIYSIFVTFWAIFLSILINQEVSYKTALFSARLSNVSAVFIPVTWFHFILFFSGQRNKFRGLLLLLYVVPVVISCFAFTEWLVPKVEPILNFKYYTRPGIVYHLHFLNFLVVVSLGFVQLGKKIKHSQGYERIQTIGFFTAAAIGFVGGGLTYLPVYEIDFPQYGLFMMPIYPFTVAYFMIRHRLFDVEQMAQAFQREKLATIGLLAASVNHEIRNPLYAVKGLLETYLENKKEGFQSKDPDEVSERALKQIERALDVVVKLNRFARPANVTAQKSEGASIAEAVTAVLGLVSAEFALDRVLIQNEVSNDLPKVRTDPRQLEEIFFNLIVNACQAMKEKGGTLTISCHSEAEGRRIHAHRSFASAQDDKVIVTIQDTGTGISPDQAKHLFEPFHTTKGEQGTGLGLYITKQIIEQNGGRITVKSQEGRGTTFYLEFNAL